MTEDFEFDIVVIEPDTKLRTRLVSQLGDGTVAGVFADTAELSEFLSSGRLAVALFGSGLANLSGLADIERVTRTHPEVAAILIVDELSTNLLQQALRAGVRDVVPGPTEPQQLLESVIRVSETLSHVHGRVALPTSDDGQLGQVITVFSTKGGAGKSGGGRTSRWSSPGAPSRPVVLVDADLQFGDVAVMLKLTPQHTIVDAVGALDRLDDAVPPEPAGRHDASGLLVLPAPLEPAFADQIARRRRRAHRRVAARRSASSSSSTRRPYFNDVVLGLIEDSDEVRARRRGWTSRTSRTSRSGCRPCGLLDTPCQAAARPQPGQQGEARRRRGRAHAADQGRLPGPAATSSCRSRSTRASPVVLDAPKSGRRQAHRAARRPSSASTVAGRPRQEGRPDGPGDRLTTRPLSPSH